MNVQELLDELQTGLGRGDFTADSEVWFSCDYGDHGRTKQALRLHTLSVLDLYESCFSDSGMAVLDETRYDDGRDNAQYQARIMLCDAVVLS